MDMRFEGKHIRYAHDKDGFCGRRWTAAFILPPKEKLVELAARFYSMWGKEDYSIFIMLPAGAALVHPEDVFKKKLGCQLARERMKENEFELWRVADETDRLRFWFKGTIVGETQVEANFALTIHKKSDAVFMAGKPGIYPKWAKVLHDVGPEPEDESIGG